MVKLTCVRKFLFTKINTISSHSFMKILRAFHRLGQAKFTYAYGGSILGLSQFTLLSQPPLKTTLNLKKDQN